MANKKTSKIPLSFQGLLWSRSIDKLDFEKDKVYIIHQTLNYGDLNQINWLRKHYNKNELKKVFLEKPQKIYTPAAFNFIKNYILELEKEQVDEEKYYSFTSRDI